MAQIIFSLAVSFKEDQSRCTLHMISHFRPQLTNMSHMLHGLWISSLRKCGNKQSIEPAPYPTLWMSHQLRGTSLQQGPAQGKPGRGCGFCVGKRKVRPSRSPPTTRTHTHIALRLQLHPGVVLCCASNFSAQYALCTASDVL